MTNQTSQATGGALQAAIEHRQLLDHLPDPDGLRRSRSARRRRWSCSPSRWGCSRSCARCGCSAAGAAGNSPGPRSATPARSQRPTASPRSRRCSASPTLQFERVLGFVERCRGLFFRTQVIAKAVPNIYQSLIFVLLVVGLMTLNADRRPASPAGCSRSCCCCFARPRARPGAVRSRAPTRPSSNRCRSSTACAAPRRATQPAGRCGGRHRCLRSRRWPSRRSPSPYTPGAAGPQRRLTSSVEAGRGGRHRRPLRAPGKSTLVQILLQLRDPLEGRYLVNGEEARSFAPEDFAAHRLVAYVPQEPRLLHASVADNIRFFRDVDDAAVERAARLARIHEDIVELGQGLRDGRGASRWMPVSRRPAAAHLPRQGAGRAARRCSSSTSPPARSIPHSETLIQESLTSRSEAS